MIRATIRTGWVAAAALGLTLAGCDGGGGTDPADAGPLPDGQVAQDGGHDHDGGEMTDGGGHMGEVTAGRLLIADHAASTVTVVDLDDTTMQWQLAVEAPGRVYAHPNSRYGYVAIGDEVQILSSGVVLESHGEHYHVEKSNPAVLEAHFHDTLATHFTVHGEDAGRYAVAFDVIDGANSRVHMLQERTLSAGTPQFGEVDLGAAFGGMAIAAFGHLIVTHPSGNGVTVREIATPDSVERAYDTQCPEVMGMAANAHGVFFGCADGLFVLEHHVDHFDADHLPTPAGARLTQLRGSAATELLVGLWGQDLVIIDVEATSPFRTIDIPDTLTVLDFGIDGEGMHLVALTDDGNLHRFALADGSAAGAPIDVLDGDDAVPPALALGAEHAFVADPSAGHVLIIHLEDWEEEGHLVVGGAPSGLAVVTMSPDYHGGHDHGGHDHDH